MGNKFWFGYIAFFVFIFPLFFSYAGMFHASAIVSTIALAIGLIGWLIFIGWTYKQSFVLPLKKQKNMQELARNGRLEQGKVLEKKVLKTQKDNTELLEIVVQFKNLSNTQVKQSFLFTDSKPYQKRYEPDNRVNLRMGNGEESPAVILADMQATFSPNSGFFAVSFLLVYMLGTFVAHYYFFSDGKGWRFINFWHPWVFTPFFGFFMYSLIGRVFRWASGKNSQQEEQLVLFGKEATATIQEANQTGTYINNQPQIKYLLNFTDDAGRTHTATLKKIVPLTQLHMINTDRQKILYLPDNPEKIMFVE